tara:strand:+ start:376 stop:759 length:384 start_codon:yes stop_codon:yes gene_type:complete
MSEKKTRRQKTAEREKKSMPEIKKHAKQLKDKGERKLLIKKWLGKDPTREPTIEERLYEAEKTIKRWKKEEREEEAKKEINRWEDDTSMGQKYDDEGNLIEIEAADGGYIKKYAYGGGVRKAKFVDS